MSRSYSCDHPSSASSDSSNEESQDDTVKGVSFADEQMSPVDTPQSPLSPRQLKSPRPKRERSLSTSKSGLAGEPVLRTPNRTIYMAGRPPWYDSQGQHHVEPFIIGLCGGSASGKTTVAKKIIEALDIPWVTLLSMDSFYKVLNEKQHMMAEENNYNFDHPDAFDFGLMIETLRKLKDGKSVDVPIYNFTTHARENKRTNRMYGANVILFEGILSFHHRDLLNIMDMKLFVDTDSDIRLARRLRRDISERGRDIQGVLEQYDKFVKPAFDYYIAPSMTHADIIVPRVCV